MSPVVPPATTKPTPTTDRRAERRRAIVEAASPLFAQLGYTDCDMERVATALGIAKGTIYLYFPGKQDLFFACVDWGMTRMQQAVIGAAETTKEPFERIGRAVRAYLEFFEKHPHFVELLIQERAMFKDRKRPTYFEYRDRNRVVWRAIYTQMQAEGTLRTDFPVERIMDVVGNLLYGTMFTNHFNGRTASLDEQYRAIMEAVFAGLLSESQRPQWTLPAPCAAPCDAPSPTSN
ncbi:MAG: TetR/AcrR family transcriptional regulator [Planctomycetaceae bacterium]|nr:TetR/AcrR family transcriptional regulator [Planctomycetaceae bacterium]